MSLPSDDLVSPFTLEYTYKRSTGPVIGRFLAGLRDGQLLGVRTLAGDVLVPPTEYEPTTGAAVTEEFVEVGPEGTVSTWTWISNPGPKDPVSAPFAWAMVHLDGASTPMLHVVLSPEATLKTGVRVRAKFAETRVGHIRDLAGFEVIA